jgi:hypothetical protein
VVDTVPRLDELIILDESGSFLLLANEGMSNLFSSYCIKLFSFRSSFCRSLLYLNPSRLKHNLCFLRCLSSRCLNHLSSMLESFFCLSSRFNSFSLDILASMLKILLGFASGFSSRLRNLLACMLERPFGFLGGFSSHS